MNPPRQSVLILIVADLSPRSSRYNYVSNLPADATLKMLAATIKARWICEQAHQQLKEELGLDHFEGRSWVGLHRHELMTMIAYAFLQEIGRASCRERVCKYVKFWDCAVSFKKKK